MCSYVYMRACTYVHISTCVATPHPVPFFICGYLHLPVPTCRLPRSTRTHPPTAATWSCGRNARWLSPPLACTWTPVPSSGLSPIARAGTEGRGRTPTRSLRRGEVEILTSIENNNRIRPGLAQMAVVAGWGKVSCSFTDLQGRRRQGRRRQRSVAALSHPESQRTKRRQRQRRQRQG